MSNVIGKTNKAARDLVGFLASDLSLVALGWIAFNAHFVPEHKAK
jgi:hypothetical protein